MSTISSPWPHLSISHILQQPNETSSLASEAVSIAKANDALSEARGAVLVSDGVAGGLRDSGADAEEAERQSLVASRWWREGKKSRAMMWDSAAVYSSSSRTI